MRILAFDAGLSTSPTGWAFYDTIRKTREYGTFWPTHGGRKNQIKSPMEFYRQAKNLFEKYKPHRVVICRPMGHFGNIIYQQGKIIGILEFMCEAREIRYFDKPDSAYRGIVFGKQLSKKDSHLAIRIADPDAADAMIAALAGASLI